MIIEITEENKYLLDYFIEKNEIPTTFRYFNKRTSDVIKNHILTILLLENNLPIGYAHIDYDEDKYWFGICILEKYHGKGFGKQMIEYIINNEKIKKITNIYLTVDKINKVAINLYQKYNFFIIEEKENYYLMSRENFVI